MKLTYYSIIDLVTEKNFSHRAMMTTSNIKELNLGPIQSKKYFEAVAILFNKIQQGSKPWDWSKTKEAEYLRKCFMKSGVK